MTGPRLVQMILLPDDTLWSTDGEKCYSSADNARAATRDREELARARQLLVTTQAGLELSEQKLAREVKEWARRVDELTQLLGESRRAGAPGLSALADEFIADFTRRAESLPPGHEDRVPCLRVVNAFEAYRERLSRSVKES